MLRNCLFEKEHHVQFMAVEMDFLSFLLMPIRGNEVFSEEKDSVGMPRRLLNVSSEKIRDPDLETRRMVVDCLILLTGTKTGRNFLKDNKVFPIVREFDKHEEDEELSMTIYKLVHVLLLDDPEDEPSEEAPTIAPAPASAQTTESGIARATPAAEAKPTSSTHVKTDLPVAAVPVAKKEPTPTPAALPKAVAPPAPRVDLDEAGEPIEEI